MTSAGQSEAEARRKADALVGQLDAGIEDAAPEDGITVGRVWREYIDHHSAHWSPGGESRLEKAWRRWLTPLEHLPVAQMTRADLQGLVDRQPMTGKQQRQLIAAIRPALKHARRLGWLPIPAEHLTEGLRLKPVEPSARVRRSRSQVSPDEIPPREAPGIAIRLLGTDWPARRPGALWSEEAWQERITAMQLSVALLGFGGLRLGELIALRVGDFETEHDLETGTQQLTGRVRVDKQLSHDANSAARWIIPPKMGRARWALMPAWEPPIEETAWSADEEIRTFSTAETPHVVPPRTSRPAGTASEIVTRANYPDPVPTPQDLAVQRVPRSGGVVSLDALYWKRREEAERRAADVGGDWRDALVIPATTGPRARTRLPDGASEYPLGQNWIGQTAFRRSFWTPMVDDLRTMLRISPEVPMHPHQWRHLAASLLLDAGMPLPRLAGTLGHASAAMTLGVYSHVIGGSVRERVELT